MITNHALIKIISDKDFFHKDTITDMLLNGRPFQTWLPYFDVFHLTLQGYAWDAKVEGYLVGRYAFNCAAIRKPLWHLEFCHPHFNDADWFYYLKHYPVECQAYQIPEEYLKYLE